MGTLLLIYINCHFTEEFGIYEVKEGHCPNKSWTLNLSCFFVAQMTDKQRGWGKTMKVIRRSISIVFFVLDPSVRQHCLWRNLPREPPGTSVLFDYLLKKYLMNKYLQEKTRQQMVCRTNQKALRRFWHWFPMDPWLRLCRWIWGSLRFNSGQTLLPNLIIKRSIFSFNVIKSN